MAQRICPFCGKGVTPRAVLCRHCQRSLEMPVASTATVETPQTIWITNDGYRDTVPPPADYFERRKKPSTALTAAAAIDVGTGGNDFNQPIVGESQYQAALRRVSRGNREAGLTVTFTAVLAAEPTNAYDANAIEIHADGVGRIGYLSRDDAMVYRDAFQLLHAHEKSGCCRAKLIGGRGRKRNFGAVLDLNSPDALLADVRKALGIAEEAQPF